MSDEKKKKSDNTVKWVSLGIGAGLLITLAAGLGYHYWCRQNEEKDPRAEQVRELIEEAERLLAHGRKTRS